MKTKIFWIEGNALYKHSIMVINITRQQTLIKKIHNFADDGCYAPACQRSTCVGCATGIHFYNLVLHHIPIISHIIFGQIFHTLHYLATCFSVPY